MIIVDQRSGSSIRIDADLADRFMNEIEEWWQQDCVHERLELRRGTNKGGAPVVRHQCMDCGKRVGNAVKRPPNAEVLPILDDTMDDDYRASRSEEMDKLNEKFIDIQLSRGHQKPYGHVRTRYWTDIEELMLPSLTSDTRHRYDD